MVSVSAAAARRAAAPDYAREDTMSARTRLSGSSGRYVRYAISGLASVASFAPSYGAHEVAVKGVDPRRSDLEALGDDWKRVGSDMRKAIGVEREKAEKST